MVSWPCPVPQLLALAHRDPQSMGGWKAPVPPCMAPAPAHGVEAAPPGLPQSPVLGWWCTGQAAHRAVGLLWGQPLGRGQSLPLARPVGTRSVGGKPRHVRPFCRSWCHTFRMLRMSLLPSWGSPSAGNGHQGPGPGFKHQFPVFPAPLCDLGASPRA